jgi:uncharacterized protein (DUF2164 family)
MAEILKVKIEFTEEQKQKLVDECIDILNDRLIEELEKIKAEMAIKTQENLDAYKDCLEIVRNHISELKGE